MTKALAKGDLAFSQRTNVGLFQIERFCRGKCKWQRVFQKGRKHCGKRRNRSLEQFVLFSQLFLKICMADTLEQGFVWKRVNVSL